MPPLVVDEPPDVVEVVVHVPVTVCHHEHEVAACAGTAGNAIAAAATVANTYFFIVIPPRMDLKKAKLQLMSMPAITPNASSVMTNAKAVPNSIFGGIARS